MYQLVLLGVSKQFKFRNGRFIDLTRSLTEKTPNHKLYQTSNDNFPDHLKSLGYTNIQAHHIASEQKRRENIRSEFDKIVSLTPTLDELEKRSELNILTKSADFIDHLKDENTKLVELCRMKGIDVPSELEYHGPTSDGSDVTKQANSGSDS